MSNVSPCECIEKVNGRWTYRCECSNGGDAEGAAAWVADENNRAEIIRLEARVKALEEELSNYARAACLAMLKAWPGSYSLAENDSAEIRDVAVIILPLTTENTND